MNDPIQYRIGRAAQLAPSWIWYQDMADFAGAITDDRAGLARAFVTSAVTPMAGHGGDGDQREIRP